VLVFLSKILETIPPYCNKCGGILKPDYIFFGEQIPEPAGTMSFNEAELCDLLIVIGTTGEIQPAAQIPYIAKRTGSKILEINIKPSLYTEEITDLYLEGKATEIMKIINNYL